MRVFPERNARHATPPRGDDLPLVSVRSEVNSRPVTQPSGGTLLEPVEEVVVYGDGYTVVFTHAEARRVGRAIRAAGVSLES